MVDNKLSRITETRNPATMEIDKLDTQQILKLINQEDAKVTLAVQQVIPEITQAVDGITQRMQKGGRLFYVGAGTSGRLGVLDAVECIPTFSVEPGRVIGILAGGKEAMFQSQENLEDSCEKGSQSLQQYYITSLDSVVGIAASGTTPFVLGALRKAKISGALTISLVCVENSPVEQAADIAIAPIVGPEVITGSTRMKAGTAQKIVLNMISTTVMVKLGKVYSNLMVDLKPSNQKLRTRAVNIFMTLTETDLDAAHQYLENASYNLKAAIIMYKFGYSFGEALMLLEKCDGILSKIIQY